MPTLKQCLEQAAKEGYSHYANGTRDIFVYKQNKKSVTIKAIYDCAPFFFVANKIFTRISTLPSDAIPIFQHAAMKGGEDAS